MKAKKFRKIAKRALIKKTIKRIKEESKNGGFYIEIYVFKEMIDIINIDLERKGFFCENLDTSFKDCIRIKISW